MFAHLAIFARLESFLSKTRPSVRQVGVPRALLEKAGARAGLGSHEAGELREAAVAYLRVVR